MVELSLTNSDLKAQVSNEDWSLCFYGWFIDKDGYIRCSSRSFRSPLLHVIVANRMKLIGKEFDHKDRVKHNCQRDNLRTSNRSLNTTNTIYSRTQKYRGVQPRSSGRFQANIRYQGHDVCLGTYDSEDDAALAYNKAATHFFGEHAMLNTLGDESSTI